MNLFFLAPPPGIGRLGISYRIQVGAERSPTVAVVVRSVRRVSVFMRRAVVMAVVADWVGAEPAAGGPPRFEGCPVGPAIHRRNDVGWSEANPVGTRGIRRPFIRPYGTGFVGQHHVPSDKSLGSCQMSLRDKGTAGP